MTDKPQATDAEEQAWINILDFEAGFRSGEPEPEPPPPPKTSWSTEEVTADLTKLGLDVSKLKLPSREWSADDVHAELTQRGITANHLSFPGDPPKRLEDRLYPNQRRR